MQFLGWTEHVLVPGGGDRLIAAVMRLADRMTPWDFGRELRAVVRRPQPAIHRDDRAVEAIARNGPMSETFIS